MKKSIDICRIVLKIIMGSLLLVLPACAPTPPPPPTPTSSSTASLTPSPTATATLTPTATFTFTPSPMPTPLAPDIGQQVIFSESFDDMDFPFGICGAAHIESGVLVVERSPENPSPCGMFSGGLYGNDPIPADTTLLVLFKTNHNFNVAVHAGTQPENIFRRFAFSVYQGAEWGLGTGEEYKSWKASMPKLNSWYYFSLKHSGNGDIDARVWERDNPENGSTFHLNAGTEWGTLPVYFVADFVDAPFSVDEIQIVK